MPQVLEFERVDRDIERESSPDRAMSIAVIVTGLVSMFAITALEPAPPHHTEATAWVWIAQFLSLAFFACAFGGAYTLLSGKQRIGYAGLMAAAWIQLGAVVGCPVSGHHNFGGWWAGQMALGLAFVTVSTVAFAISRSQPERRPTGV